MIKIIDKINYFDEPFGPSWHIPNSLYGIHNPPLKVYITKEIENTKNKIIISDMPFEIIDNKRGESIKILLSQLMLKINNTGSIHDVKKYKNITWSKIKLDNGELNDVMYVKNNSNSVIELYTRYFGKNEIGEDLAYGLANQKYKGRRFRFTTWVKTDKHDCVSLGFYQGNVSGIGWGYGNDLANDKYQLLWYEGSIDDPYSLNGNIRYKIDRACTVKLIKPKLIIYK